MMRLRAGIAFLYSTYVCPILIGRISLYQRTICVRLQCFVQTQRLQEPEALAHQGPGTVYGIIAPAFTHCVNTSISASVNLVLVPGGIAIGMPSSIP